MASPSSTSGLPGSSRLSETINRWPMTGFCSAPCCRVISLHRVIRRCRFSVWLRIRFQPQPAPISSLSCTRWSEPQAGAIALMPPLPVPERQRSGASNSVHPSQTVNDGIKDGTDGGTHRLKPSHSSRSRPLHTDTLSVSGSRTGIPEGSRDVPQIPETHCPAVGFLLFGRPMASRQQPRQANNCGGVSGGVDPDWLCRWGLGYEQRHRDDADRAGAAEGSGRHG